MATTGSATESGEHHNSSVPTSTDNPVGAQPVVVVGVDGSAASQQALLFAAREATLRKAVLRIVTSHDLRPVVYGYAGGFDMGFEIGPLENRLKQAAEALVKAAADTVAGSTSAADTPITVETFAVQGRASEVLLHIAKGAALLVVGARGAGAFTRLMMGSTSTEVVHHAHLPVTVVPSDDRHGAETT
ncbi:MAG: universal stress protein [Nocardioidaceae bacterium]